MASSTSTEDMTASASLSLGDSYFVDENYDEAVDAYAAALSVVRDSKEQDVHVRALSHRSAAFYHLGRYEEALEDAQSALHLSGTDSNSNASSVPVGLRPGEAELFHKRVGMAAMQLGQYEKAKAEFEKAVQLATLNQRSNYKAKIAEYDASVAKCIEKMMSAKEDDADDKPIIEELDEEDKKPQSDKKPAAGTPVPAKPKATPFVTPEPKMVAKPKPAPAVTNTSDAPPTMPKYQYYQDDNFMKIAILEPNVQREDLEVEFEKKRLVVTLNKKGTSFTVIAGTLYSEVNVDKCKTIIKAEKVLIKLKKVDKFEWHELLNKKDDAKAKPKSKPSPSTTSDSASPAPAANEAAATDSGTEAAPTESKPKAAIPRPYASHKDWDKIGLDLKKEEEAETGEGDEALNKLFKQIYGNADEDTRRAMVKSYQTSGGTVLSTNWNEVEKKDYEKERTAPKGMEWKTWEGDKLPMTDDD